MTKKHIRLLVFALIGTLIFEGITRKVVPPGIGKFLILLKDVILVLIAAGVITSKISGSLGVIRNVYFAFAALLSPLIVFTFLRDPILAVYGAKQYLLYPYAMFGYVIGFQNYRTRDFVTPARFMTVLLIPITMLALVQVFLPSTHWLNLSVAGEDLSAFSAGGRLRVSSTFSFVAQFCYYLSILLPILWVTSTLRRKKSSSNFITKLESLYIIIPLFIIANAVTGSRLAVLTNVMVIVFAAGLLVIRGRTQNIGRLMAFTVGIFVSVFVARLIVPEAFEAYEARAGDNVIVDEEEISKRADHILTGWWKVYKYQNPGVFGFGVGVMSNGVQNFSPYAASIRDRVWGETDLANIVLEGGVYFVFIWMLTRISIVIVCFSIFQSISHSKLIYAASFSMGYIIFNGLTQTLGTQPPLAIWWWLSIGLLIHLKRFEVYQTVVASSKKSSSLEINPSKKGKQQKTDRSSENSTKLPAPPTKPSPPQRSISIPLPKPKQN